MGGLGSGRRGLTKAEDKVRPDWPWVGGVGLGAELPVGLEAPQTGAHGRVRRCQ